MTTYGFQIRAARAFAANWSLEQLARKARVDSSAIKKMETSVGPLPGSDEFRRIKAVFRQAKIRFIDRGVRSPGEGIAAIRLRQEYELRLKNFNNCQCSELYSAKELKTQNFCTYRGFEAAGLLAGLRPSARAKAVTFGSAAAKLWNDAMSDVVQSSRKEADVSKC